jgi:hypothetical protein
MISCPFYVRCWRSFPSRWYRSITRVCSRNASASQIRRAPSRLRYYCPRRTFLSSAFCVIFSPPLLRTSTSLTWTRVRCRLWWRLLCCTKRRWVHATLTSNCTIPLSCRLVVVIWEVQLIGNYLPSNVMCILRRYLSYGRGIIQTFARSSFHVIYPSSKYEKLQARNSEVFVRFFNELHLCRYSSTTPINWGSSRWQENRDITRELYPSPK